MVEQRLLGDSSAFAPVPGLEDALAPLVEGWVWVVTTPDAVRQQRAMELIAWLALPENLAPWSQASRLVPARRSALALWTPANDYFNFLASELERAAPFPIATSDSVLNALAIAAVDVLSLARSPAAAAQEAVEALRP
jgi:ABC-type glycerol-3-phosphate transport system substrate-binding protein